MGHATARRSNRRVAVLLAALAAGGVGLAFASVPLYRLFCEVTGYGGYTQRADVAPEVASDRMVTVRFNADVNGGLSWSFAPAQSAVAVPVGQSTLAFYRATNRSDQPVTGTATFNVTPDEVGRYFTKIECFCFTEQTLQPGQTVSLPVSFFLDPAMLADRDLDDVKTVTLSYTFFRAHDDGQAGQGQQASVRGGTAPGGIGKTVQ